jgi:hypothetical protein
MSGVTADSERQWWRTLLGLPDPEWWRLGAKIGPAAPYEVPREVAEEGSRPVPSRPSEPVVTQTPRRTSSASSSRPPGANGRS